jgi:hypothetical protein
MAAAISYQLPVRYLSYGFASGFVLITAGVALFVGSTDRSAQGSGLNERTLTLLSGMLVGSGGTLFGLSGLYPIFKDGKKEN